MLFLALFTLFGLALTPSLVSAQDALIVGTLNGSDFTFSDDEFVLGLSQNFSTAITSNISVLTSFNIIKNSGGGSNDVFIRMNISGIEVLNERVRTVSSVNDEGSTATSPVLIELADGEHNITMEVRRTGNGVIEVDDFDFVLIQMITGNGSLIEANVINGTYTTNSTTFTNVTNYSIVKTITSPAYVIITQHFSDSVDDILVEFQDFNVLTGISSAFTSRVLQTSGETGSVLMATLQPNNSVTHNHSLQTRVSTGTISSNFSILEFDVGNSTDSAINVFNATNILSNNSNPLAFGSGLFNLANFTTTVLNGTGFFITAIATLNSTSGSLIPRIFVNSSNSTAVCFSEKHRSLGSTGDVGNVKLFTVCNNLTVSDTYVFNLWIEIPIGKTLTVIDEVLIGIETIDLNLTNVNLPPTIGSFLKPIEGESIGGVVGLDWEDFSDPEGNPVTYNVSLLNADFSFNQTLNGSSTQSNQTFNTTTVAEGPYVLFVEACDLTQIQCSNNSVNFTVSQLAVQTNFIFQCMNSGNLTACPGLKTLGDNTDNAPIASVIVFLFLMGLFAFLALEVDLPSILQFPAKMFFSGISLLFGILAIYTPANTDGGTSGLALIHYSGLNVMLTIFVFFVFLVILTMFFNQFLDLMNLRRKQE